MVVRLGKGTGVGVEVEVVGCGDVELSTFNY